MSEAKAQDAAKLIVQEWETHPDNSLSRISTSAVCKNGATFFVDTFMGKQEPINGHPVLQLSEKFDELAAEVENICKDAIAGSDKDIAPHIQAVRAIYLATTAGSTVVNPQTGKDEAVEGRRYYTSSLQCTGFDAATMIKDTAVGEILGDDPVPYITGLSRTSCSSPSR